MRTGHIWAPEPDMAEIRIVYCPTDERECEMLGLHYEWLGWDITCLSCGERWSDGERLPRPFERGWRKRRIEEAKRTIERYGVQRMTERKEEG